MRAWTSKKSILAFITITLSVKMMNLQNPHFYSPHHQKSPPQKLPLQPMWRFLSNNVSFSPKQRVVFSQTTCRFLPNNASFSLKQRVVFSQTTYRFLPNNVSFSLICNVEVHKQLSLFALWHCWLFCCNRRP